MGIPLATVRYLHRRTPLERETVDRLTRAEVPDSERAFVGAEGAVQRREEGVGPLFQRRYCARIRGSRLLPEDLIAKLVTDPNVASPVEVAEFEASADGPEPGRLGAEMVVRMPGPWDGPVRVVERAPTSFRLATLRGHMEAGEILFEADSDGDDLRFTITSWARSGDRLFHVLYDRLWVAREMQLHMWVHFLERIAEVSGGRIEGKVQVQTCRWRDEV